MKINATNTSNPGLTVHCRVNFGAEAKGRMNLRPGPLPPAPPIPCGRVPRIARLMALALRFDDLLRRGEVRDYADLARLGHVTRARVTQVMNLLQLAPDIQEALLFLPPVEEGRDPVKEWQVRPIAAQPVWAEQRRMWRRLLAAAQPA
jgi:hypothetical protein